MNSHLTDTHKSFLKLVRLGIGHADSAGYIVKVDWEQLKALVDRQGLSAIVLDGIDTLQSSSSSIVQEFKSELPLQMKLQWIGDVIQNYEGRYIAYEKAISSLAGFYHRHGYKMMVLKGYACSLDWTNPKHRPCGDIDIWQFGQWKEADVCLSKEKGVKIDASHHHHTVFEWKGFPVENHYDFVNVYAERSSAELEKIFKELGTDDSHFVGIMDASTGSVAKVYLPSPNLHAMFLIRHMVSHFASSEINLRQVLDWAFFVEKHTKEIGWNWLLGVLDKYHMKEFFNLINAICVEDLGFSVEIFPEAQFVSELKERVLEDILDPEYTAAEPKGFFPRVIYKYKRWQGNAWKQEMCYGESRWVMFWTGIWAKILKPASI